MKTACIAVLSCLPFVAGAQSLQTEFDSLKARRDAAMKEATEPIDSKFSAAATQLLAKAIQKGELDAAATIRKAIPAGPTATFAKNELDTFLESKSWKYTTSENPQWGNVLEFKPDGKIGTQHSPQSFVNWEKVGPNQVKIVMSYDRTFTFDYRPSEKRLFSQSKGEIRTLTVINPNS